MSRKGAEEEGLSHFPQYIRAPSDLTAEEPVVHVRPRQSRNSRDPTQDSEHKSTLAFTHLKISLYFHLPLVRAARALQISGTALKQVCRRLNIRRWPYTRGGLKRMGIDKGFAAQDSFDRLGYNELIDDTTILDHTLVRRTPIDSSRHQQQQETELHQRLKRHLESQNYPFTYTTPSHAQLFQEGGLNMLQHQCAQGHELSRQDSNTVERALMRNAFSRDLLNHGAQARTAPGNPTSMSLDQAGATSSSALRRPACSTANALAASADVWNSQVTGQAYCLEPARPESSSQVGDVIHDFSCSRSARIVNVTSDYNHYYCDDDLSWLLSFNSELARACSPNIT
jgi:hypothetical protein